MPDKEEILSGLQKIVNSYSILAIVWHVIFYFLLAVIIFFWRPSDKILVLVICLPVISVSALAWLSGNPFNGFLFSVLAVLVIVFGIRASGDAITVSQIPYMVVGIIMIAFGMVYPHFIKADTLLKYLYASPFGLIPCPTLSVIIGLFLLYNGSGSQPLAFVFVIFGLFYGIFGVLKLAVYLDIFLVFGTVALLIKYLSF